MARFYDPRTAATGLVEGDLPDVGDRTDGLLADVTGLPSSRITPDVAARAGEMNFRDAAGIPGEVGSFMNYPPDPTDLVHKVSDAPPFDPSKPYQVMPQGGPPPFDPSKPYSVEGPQTISDSQINMGPEPDTLKTRSIFLPIGKTQSGEIVPALPQLLEGPRKTITDLIEGKRGAGDITGKEIFDLGSLFAGASPAAGSGKAIAEVAGLAKNKAPGAATKVSEPTSVETAGIGRTIAKNVEDTISGKGATSEKPQVLSTPEIRAQSDALYKAADASGIVIKNDTFGNLVGDIQRTMARQGFDKDIQPKAAAALRRLQSDVEDGANPTLSQMDILRQVARGAATSADSNERRISRIIVSKIDDFMGALTPNDVIGGDTANGPQFLTQARQLWAQKAKGEQIDQLFEKALNTAPNYSASGFENALKNQFKTLANNPNRMRQFTPDEQSAILDVVRGGDAQSAMRKLGKFSPNAGFFSMLLTGEIAAHALENPTLLAIPVIGGIARAFATARTNKAATNVSELVRGGRAMADYQKAQAAQKAQEANTFGSAIQRGGLFGSPLLSGNNQ